ncbi:MAG: ribosome maturation factor RimM [Bdellovibrionota bacterium]
MQKRWIQLGIVGKAHGLNGAFFVSQRDDELPEELKSLRIGPTQDKSTEYKIKAVRWQNDRPVLHCEEIKSRTEAESLTHQKIWADRDLLPIDEDEEYFWSDVIGKKLLDSAGVPFGEVTEVVNFGASDIVVVIDGKGRTAEIPFVELYFNMDFEVEDDVIHMLVTADVFDEVWTTE